jgi:hypothetical protein
MMVGTCYAGPIEDGEVALRPLRASRTPLLDLVGPTSSGRGRDGVREPAGRRSTQITLDAVAARRGLRRPGHAWTRGFFAALGPFGEGVYVNFLGGDEVPDRVREAYGDSVYDRLVDEKTTDLDEREAENDGFNFGRHAP